MTAIRQITCRSVMVKSGLADYAMNPYTGCGHKCVYCYASFMSRFSRHAEPWGEWVDVKVNAPSALDKDIRRLERTREQPTVILSSVTDAYQPAERDYRITRSCLELMASSAVPLKISMLTKSDLVTRDIDVLRDFEDVEVGMTVTTTEDAVSRLYEPGAPPVSRRFGALARMSGAGLRTWAFVAPVLPYHSDSPTAIKELLRRLAESGVARIMVDRFNPYPASASRFLRVAPAEAAQALREYTSHPDEYLSRLRSIIEETADGLAIGVETLFH